MRDVIGSNYLFAGADCGGERAASSYSLIGTVKLDGLDPEAHLRYVLDRIAEYPINRINELLPWNVVVQLPSLRLLPNPVNIQMIYRPFLALLLTLAVSASALAGPHICWIDSVVLDGEGVRVIFSGSGWNHTGSTKSRGRFVIGHGDITWLSEPRQTEIGLLLKQSEGALLIGGVENSCTIEFAEIDGRKGINAHASASLSFTGPPTEKTEFIPATDKSTALPK